MQVLEMHREHSFEWCFVAGCASDEGEGLKEMFESLREPGRQLEEVLHRTVQILSITTLVHEQTAPARRAGTGCPCNQA